MVGRTYGPGKGLWVGLEVGITQQNTVLRRDDGWETGRCFDRRRVTVFDGKSGTLPDLRPSKLIEKVREAVAPSHREDRLAEASRFDLQRAIKLGAHAYAAYWDPRGHKWQYGKDGTRIGFHAHDLLGWWFHSRLVVEVKEAKGLPPAGRELPRVVNNVLHRRPLDRNSTSSYVVVEVRDANATGLAATGVRAHTSHPDFNQSFEFYILDPHNATLTLHAKKKNIIGEDSVIGTARLSLTDAMDVEHGGEWEGWLDLDARPFVSQDQTAVTYAEKHGQIRVKVHLCPLRKDGENVPQEAVPDEGSLGLEPHSVLEDVDWSEFGDTAGLDAMQLDRYQLACFLENKETDTQAAIWRDTKAKEMIIAFRGTGVSIGAVVTDLMIIQSPLTEAKGEQRMVHSGFLKGYRSINSTCWRAIEAITGGRPQDWSYEVAGHSAGGCMSILLAYELATRYPDLAKEGRIVMYSQGAPRVGNTAFCHAYDEVLRDTSFRLINDYDMVARMPRATNKPPFVNLDYAHCGRAVMVTDKTESGGILWVEGEDEGLIPGIHPFASVETMPQDMTSQEADEERIAKFIGVSHSSYYTLLLLRRLAKQRGLNDKGEREGQMA